MIYYHAGVVFLTVGTYSVGTIVRKVLSLMKSSAAIWQDGYYVGFFLYALSMQRIFSEAYDGHYLRYSLLHILNIFNNKYIYTYKIEVNGDEQYEIDPSWTSQSRVQY